MTTARAVPCRPGPDPLHGGALDTQDSAAARYERARRALDRNSMAEFAAGIDYETPEFRRLNRDVWEAERGVPWWRRWLITRRVLRELGYWRHMRGDAR